MPLDDSYTGPIFRIFVAPNAPAGTYFGSIDILGDFFNGPGDLSVLATQSFQVTVTPEPEVAGITLAGLIGLVVAGCRRRSKFC